MHKAVVLVFYVAAPSIVSMHPQGGPKALNKKNDLGQMVEKNRVHDKQVTQKRPSFDEVIITAFAGSSLKSYYLRMEDC